MIRNKKPKLVFMSETRLVEDIDEKEVNVKLYKLIRCDLYTRSTGGVAILVRSGIEYKVIYNDCIIESLWSLAIRRNKGRLKGIYAVIHKSHMVSDHDVIDAFQTWCENVLPRL